MKRRKFFEKAGLGSAALVSLSALGDRLTTPAEAQGKGNEKEIENGHGHGKEEEALSGPLANATVGFGAWRTDFSPPLDRYPNVPPAIPANAHHLLPFQVTIKAGGSVNFIISGLHQVIVYGPGTKPEDIAARIAANPSTLIRPTTGVPAGVPLINVPNNRLYVGPDPSTQTLDRVEVVHFPERGLHLVICGVLPHFLEGMIGYVRVLK